MKPTNIIQDLLRTYGQRGTTVQQITETGDLFGFNSNQIRVTLSRLVNRGVVENVARGRYRLCKSTDPINSLAESWRQGEARIKPWTGRWLCAHLSCDASEKSNWSLTSFGFASVESRFYIRPDNLLLTVSALQEQLASLGLSNSILISDAKLEPYVSNLWAQTFDCTALEHQYKKMEQTLKKSLSRLPKLSASEAKKESFEIGGRAIQMLAKDPLAPEQMLSPKNRHQLWQTTVEYDKAGRTIWSGINTPNAVPISQTQFQSSEIHP